MRSRTVGSLAAALLGLATLVGLSTPANARAAAPICQGREATVVQEPGANTVNGTAGDDVIVATGRDAYVTAYGGNDLVCLVDGVVRAGGGHDSIEARGTDRKEAVSVVQGEDLDISLGAGPDKVKLRRVGDGHGTIDAGPGGAELTVWQRSVILDLRGHGLTVDGSGWYRLKGFNDAWVSARSMELVGDRHSNRLQAVGTSCDIRIAGGGGADTLSIVDEFNAPAPHCSSPSHRLLGQAGDDDLRGREGEEALIGGAGFDHARGGKGIDRCEAERELQCER
jgi:Ca2+-binding RTX toxin-like protein